jgi:hypothetical protein
MITGLIIGAIVAAIAGAAAGKRANFFADILGFWRRSLERELDDAARLAAGQAKVDELEHDAAQLASHTVARTLELAEVHRDYGSTLADYDAVIDALVAELYADQTRIVDRVAELRATIGDDVYLRIMSELEPDLRKAKARRGRS